MSCLNNIFKVWPDKHFVQGEKNTGGKGYEGSFQVNNSLRALLAALTTLSSALSLVFKKMPRPLVLEAFGVVWVLGGL